MQRILLPAGRGVLLAGLVLHGAVSMAAGPTAPSSAPPETVPYINNNFGFEVRVPASWQYERTGLFGPGGSLGLLRGGTLDSRTALQILLFRDVKAESFSAWVRRFSDSLAAIRGVQRVGVRGQPHGSHPGAFVVVDSQLGLDRVHTDYYCVQFDRTTIWVMSCASATTRTDDSAAPDLGGARQVQVRPEFERLAGSLRVFYDPRRAAELAEALRRGRALLRPEHLAQAARDVPPEGRTRYYVVELNGKPVGYLTRRLSRGHRSLDDPRFAESGKEGLRVQERSWRFGEDGSVHYTVVDLFSSLDGRSDLYDVSNARLGPSGSDDSQALITRDQCVREGEVLFSSYVTSRDPLLPDPREPLRLEDTFLGLAWMRSVPLLLGTQPGPMVAFTTYDTETRTIMTQSVVPLGPQPQAGAGVVAYRLRVGFSEQPTMLYADQHGRMVRLKSGPLTIRLSDRDRIERRFGPLRERAVPRLEHAQRRRGG